MNMVHTSIARFPGSPRNLRHLKQLMIYAMLVTKVKESKLQKARCNCYDNICEM